jgi:hypothetical protein
MTDSIDSFLSEWTIAERDGDTEHLKALLTDEFYGVGPLGFILPRTAWLARHGPGGLAYETVDLDEVQTQQYGEVVIVTARNNTRGTYQGHPIPEAVRATLVIVADRHSLRLAAIHMSFIAGTAGAPPIPGAAGRQNEGGSARNS